MNNAQKVCAQDHDRGIVAARCLAGAVQCKAIDSPILFAMSQPKIAHYQLQSRLGQGAMGVVFRAHDERLERDVALKLLQVNLAENEAADYAARLLQEARSAARLNHPGIITVYDCGEWRGKPYLAMELVQGITLKDWLEKRGALSIRQVISIARQMFAALGHAHRHKVIHRDIKPANLMLTKEGRLKITDFGIAQLPASDLTRTGTVLGSPRYMSPEQLAGKKLDGRADLYSAGVVLYQCLTGKAPFDGETTMNIVYQVLHFNPPAPHEVRPEVPRALSDLVMRCLAKSADQRYASLDAALAALLGGETDPQRQSRAPEDPTQAFDTQSGATAATPSSNSPLWPWVAQTGVLLAWLGRHGLRAARCLGRWLWRGLQVLARGLQRWTPVIWAKAQSLYQQLSPRVNAAATRGWLRFRALPPRGQIATSIVLSAVLVWGLWPRSPVAEIEFAQSAPLAEHAPQLGDAQLAAEQQQRNQLLAKMGDAQAYAQPPESEEGQSSPELTAPPLRQVKMSQAEQHPEQVTTTAAAHSESGLLGQLQQAGQQMGRDVHGLFNCLSGQSACPNAEASQQQQRRP
ncbi:serine/threonine protein kinase [Chitinibacter fontanus]|uniref:non-specific serine/threonine protein kinase n=1 Tax=Chitinibacter fontanus TaxID=1737446 RepID=A0A7D5Z882_9NEIS|nr:serine/threonine-protein kinase [Chitinibacter fontanus]QLI82002.1 serine/threonine protein kinase [Chitinibacter fontanus]